MNGKIVGINISKEKGTEKKPVASVRVTELGLEGDAHAGKWHRQVSLLSRESVTAFEKKAGISLEPGAFAENILLEGIDLSKASLLDRFTMGDVELEVTQIGKKCHGGGCSIFQRVGECAMPKEGLFARVVRPGTITAGMAATHTERPLSVRVITLSDRASEGVYEDLSGRTIVAQLEEFFAATRWHLSIDRVLIPDDAEKLKNLLVKGRDEGIDLIFTTGGTGIGPRDITPDTIIALADKEIPGIMDHIRIKYGAELPSALISRSVAAVMGGTIVFALPGSVKAVKEYMSEIIKNTEHLLLMLHGLGH